MSHVTARKSRRTDIGRVRCLSLLVVLGCAANLLAVSYVVPKDQFEIERSSAIVLGRVLRSHVERVPESGLETVTDVALEEAIKGDPGFFVQVHVPGGVLDEEGTLLPGAPSFAEGERVLLFLYRRADGSFAVNDLQLGAFHFVQGVSGEGLFLRDESELVGWDPDGRIHEERPRHAERFLDYIRGIARGESVPDRYFVSQAAFATGLQPRAKVASAAFTATSYMLQYTGGVGSRWNVFPAAVNWNQGNSETGALGSGTPQINAAFSSWNAGGTHYVLAGATANPNGFLDAADGINNIVFEKNLTSAGVQPFSCTNGGVLGLGGMHTAGFGGGAHVFHGETFATTHEADVSMNQGVGGCTTSQLALSEFASVITHELGHTLGFRHSDQTRLSNADCSTDVTLECSSQAIMNHILVSGLNGHLQTWDKTALDAVYGSGPACAPPSITQQPSGATIISGNSAILSVTATGTPTLTYQWFVGQSGNTATPVGSKTPAISVSPAVTTSYWVRVAGQCAPNADSITATITVTAVPCSAPKIVSQPQDQTVVAGSTAFLTIGFTGTSTSVTWFQGAKGDSSTPVGPGPAFTTPVLTQTTQFWARITNSCGSVDSDAATIAVTARPAARRRAVRH